MGGTSGSGGSGVTGKSCSSGANYQCNGESCCARGTVTGGNFTLGGSVEFPSSGANVSTFVLDKYEVTVGRFRRYLEAFPGPPAEGDGLHPKIADSGWQTSWVLPADSNAFKAALKCSATNQTWTDALVSAEREKLPINCLSWYAAFAFCIWDGGRLPTEAEWEYAATRGSVGAAYPWGPGAPTSSHAVYDCMGDGTAGCTFADILVVGSKPTGMGLYGQYDQAGSLWEWALDLHQPYPAACDDCGNVTTGSSRVLRGGSFFSTSAYINPKYRSVQDPNLAANVRQYAGVRCAHDM
jgi:formylglycine-generating enzyme required for sulfatase activity